MLTCSPTQMPAMTPPQENKTISNAASVASMLHGSQSNASAIAGSTSTASVLPAGVMCGTPPAVSPDAHIASPASPGIPPPTCTPTTEPVEHAPSKYVTNCSSRVAG